MARTSAALLGLVLLAGIAAGARGQERTVSALPELDQTSQMTRKMLEGNETTIEPCSPAYKGKHPRGFLARTPGKICSSNATVCTKFDDLQCGMIEECKNVTTVNCTEYTTVKTFYGGLKQKCTNATSTVETKCKDFEVCTYFACVPKAPGAPETVATKAPVAPGPTAAPVAPGPTSGR